MDFLQNKPYLSIWSHRTPYLTFGKSFQLEGQALHPLLPEDSFNSEFNLLMSLPQGRRAGRGKGFAAVGPRQGCPTGTCTGSVPKAPTLTAGPKPDFNHNTRKVMLLTATKSDKGTNLYKLVWAEAAINHNIHM